MKRIVAFLGFVMLFTSLFAQKTYRGAEVYSTNQVLYGKFVMSMKMIKGSGMLSTFFTFKSSSIDVGVFWEEIDIEVLGKNNATVLSTNIITNGVVGENTHDEEAFDMPFSLADDFHTYTLIWTPDSVVWFIDNELIRKETDDVVDTLENPQGYRFNAWISCSQEWVGPLNPADLPQYQYVDWIEYYSYDAETFTFEWRDDFDSFDASRWAKASWTFDCNEVDFIPENAYTEDSKLVLALTDPNPPSASINAINSEELVQVSNNRTNSELQIKLSEFGHFNYKIFNLQGMLLISDEFVGESAKITYEGLGAGIYFLNVRSKDIFETIKVIID